MALLSRELGVPSRVVYGATDPNGIYGGIDEKHRRAYQVGATKWSELEALSDQLAEKAEKAA
jgi:hypothetical protein